MKFLFLIIFCLSLIFPVLSDDSGKSIHDKFSISETNRIETFGRTFIYSDSPDFETNVIIQKGNTYSQSKIRLKKSSEITHNHFGGMPCQLPRTPKNDYTSHWTNYYYAPWENYKHPGDFLAKNLIDDDLKTEWCSRGQNRPNIEPQWLRLDFVKEQIIKEIKIYPSHLIKRFKNLKLPKTITVKLSTDSWHWKTVYKNESVSLPDADEPLVIKLQQPLPAKQVWVVGEDLSLAELPFGEGQYYFMCGEIRVINTKGENVALSSRGTGIQVSSTYYGTGSQWEIYEYLWPTIWDQGFKWVRISGWGGTLLWSSVEREKGKYVIDKRTDKAITELADNDIEIMMILAYSNPVYGHRFWGDYYLKGESREGFKNYARFMAKHFKGRVKTYEIWNEPGIGKYEDLKVYCDLLKDAAEVIRKVDPDAKISFAGLVYQFFDPEVRKENYAMQIFDVLQENSFVINNINVAKLVDAFSWHGQGGLLALPGSDGAVEKWKMYKKEVRDFRQAAESNGFKGVLKMSEFWIGAPYPPGGSDKIAMTEIQKAKDTARCFMLQAGLDVLVFWCNNWLDQLQLDDGFFRRGFAADPISPVQPNATYYVLRNLCTIMDQAKPCDKIKLSFSKKSNEIETFGFSYPREQHCFALWLNEKSIDTHPGVEVTVNIENIKAEKIVGIDTLNGFEQELNYQATDEDILVPHVLLRDYPLILKIEGINSL